MLQEYKHQNKDKSEKIDIQSDIFDPESEKNVKDHLAQPSVALHANDFYSQNWNDYIVKLSSVLCSFLLAPEDIKSHNIQISSGRISMSISSLYIDLSIKWFMRVLLTVFPCLKACSNQNELPIHLR